MLGQIFKLNWVTTGGSLLILTQNENSLNPVSIVSQDGNCSVILSNALLVNLLTLYLEIRIS